MRKLSLLVIFIFHILVCSYAQTEENTKTWDNQLYVGNKIAAGKNNWRYSGELQLRLKDNTQSLDNYFVEGVATYLVSEKWEIAPDLRLSIKPDELELRPGFSLVQKTLWTKFQLVNQVKWQMDFDTKGNSDNAMRYVVFLNYKISNKVIPNFIGGGFYKWSPNFTGFQYFRFGPGVAFVIDKRHVLNFNYLFAAANTGQTWNWAGIPVIQLVINIRKEFNYMPAKYFNF